MMTFQVIDEEKTELASSGISYFEMLGYALKLFRVEGVVVLEMNLANAVLNVVDVHGVPLSNYFV